MWRLNRYEVTEIRRFSGHHDSTLLIAVRTQQMHISIVLNIQRKVDV